MANKLPGGRALADRRSRGPVTGPRSGRSPGRVRARPPATHLPRSPSLGTAAGLHSPEMDAARSEPAGSRFEELHAEAAEALAYAANSVRSIRDRYRAAYRDEMGIWQQLSDDLATFERATASGDGAESEEMDSLAASAAEAGAADLRLRFVRGEAERTRAGVAAHEADLSRLELAAKNLESTWLFLERGDHSLVADASLPAGMSELQMRIVEAQESERNRLAQEVHDGPAQALSNAIFQVEYIERIFESEPVLAKVELGFLRELLRRELGDVRSFIVQLRPPVLVELGLDGSIRDTVETQRALTGLAIATDLSAPSDGLPEAAQTVALRIAQEALQNVRKHASATSVLVATRLEGTEWVLEVRDDGRGFDTGAVAARGRRNFGLQFMRERAELVGARFEVQSRPDAGTVVRLAIPLARKENG
jgi:signal transduction histidine kinase